MRVDFRVSSTFSIDLFPEIVYNKSVWFSTLINVFSKAAVMAVFQHPSRKRTPFDVLVVGLLLLAALVSFLFTLSRDGGTSCTISYDGTNVTYPLTVDRTLVVASNGHTLTVVIENGAVAVAESDCPDGVCVNSGKISRSGQAVVCIPAEVTVKISGAADNDPDVDAVVGGVG